MWLADGSGWTGLRLANGRQLLDPIGGTNRLSMTHPAGLGFVPQKYLVRPACRVSLSKDGLLWISEVCTQIHPTILLGISNCPWKTFENVSRTRVRQPRRMSCVVPLRCTVDIRYRMLAFVGAPLKLRKGPELLSDKMVTFIHFNLLLKSHYYYH